MQRKGIYSARRNQNDVTKEGAFNNAIDQYDARLMKCDAARYQAASASSSDEWDTDIEDDDVKDTKFDTTGVGAYINCCKILGISPSTKVVKDLSGQYFSVVNGGLGAKTIKCIVAALIANTHVKTLDFQGNNISLDGVEVLRYLLRENFYITELNLADNGLGNEASDTIGNIMRDTKYVSCLNIAGNGFDDSNAHHIGNGIAMNTSIRILNLSHNQFMTSAGKSIGMAIEVNRTIKELDLSWNCLRGTGAIAFANGIAWNTGVTWLNLSFDGFANNGAEAMGRALERNNMLKHLDLSYNRIADEGAEKLSQGLAKNTSLKSLNLSYNPISKDGGFCILNAVKDAREIAELLLEEIYLDARTIAILQAIFKQDNRRIKITYQGLVKDTKLIRKTKAVDIFKNKIFRILKDYLRDHRMRMLDLFQKWDKDKSLALSPDEFIEGCMNAKIPLTIEMIEFMVKCLDKDKNGKIEYQEFVAISKLT
eukprot:gene3743-4265_t